MWWQLSAVQRGCCGRCQEQCKPVFFFFKTYFTEITSCFPRYDRQSSATVIQNKKSIFLRSWDCASLMYSSKTNKMRRYTMVFITINALHVSGGSSAHHQELKTVYTASGICRAFSASYRYRE